MMAKKLILYTITLVITLSSFVNLKAEEIYLASTPDSLFIQASEGSVRFSKMIAPARQKLIEMDSLAVAYLVAQLGTKNPGESHTLMSLLPQIGRPAVKPLIASLSLDSIPIIKLSAYILGEIGDSTAVEMLKEFTNHSDGGVRVEIYTALGKIGEENSLQNLMNGLNDENPTVRKACASGLGNMGNAKAIPILINAFNDPFFGVRYAASASLVKMGEATVKPLIKNLKSKTKLPRYHTIETIGNLKNKRAISPLTNLLEADDFYTRALTVEALYKLAEIDDHVITILNQQKKTEKHPYVKSKFKEREMK